MLVRFKCIHGICRLPLAQFKRKASFLWGPRFLVLRDRNLWINTSRNVNCHLKLAKWRVESHLVLSIAFPMLDSFLPYFSLLFTGTSSPTHGILPPDLIGISLHESSEMGLCSEPEPLAHKVEKRSYLPPISCTDDHEMEALQSKVHCQPRPRVVHLPWPNDTSFHQVWPNENNAT